MLLSTLTQAGTGGGQFGEGAALGVSGCSTVQRGDPLAVGERLGDVDEGEDPLVDAGVQVVHCCQPRLLVQFHQLIMARKQATVVIRRASPRSG